jgi:hypothetical protein
MQMKWQSTKLLLELLSEDYGRRLNVSDTTIPIGRVDCDCLTDIGVQSVTNASRSVHILTEDVLPGKKARLVNSKKYAAVVQRNDPDNSIAKGMSIEAAIDRAFAAGAFAISDIAFDEDHNRALVSHSFYCGRLCGNGNTWLFEKVNGVWKRTDRYCGGWIS